MIQFFRKKANAGTDSGPTRGHDPGPRKFGTFGGVFTPDVLTILGIIMYLRLGWVVGNTGFLGALLIIIISKSISSTLPNGRLQCWIMFACPKC